MPLRNVTVSIVGDQTGGLVYSQDAVYANARSGSNLAFTASVGGDYLAGQRLTGGIYHVRQYHHAFDTSFIGGGSVISVDSLYFKRVLDASTTDFTVEARGYDWGDALGTADFVSGTNLGTYPLLASKGTAGWGDTWSGADIDAAFAGYINKTGMTRFITASSRQRTGDVPAGDEYIEFATEHTTTAYGDRPKLVLTYRPTHNDGPETIPGMLWWLRAEDYPADANNSLATVFDVGGQFAQKNFTDSSITVVSGADGYRYFNFGGNYIRRSDAGMLPAAGWTLMFVVKPANTGAIQILFDTDVDNANSRTLVQIAADGTFGFLKDGAGGNITVPLANWTALQNTWMIVTAMNMGSGVAGSQFRFNGAVMGTATLTGSASGARHTIGHRMDNSAGPWTKPVAHSLAWNRPLSELEMWRAERYLMAKYKVDAWTKRLVVPG